ncbi:MAG: toxin co-regulated pilus biosynthesis Q family protein [Burkholderiales bacterium]|jgi:hypothetical protein|nr:toxin co-regulated pilus biosynthesis Q family protein [Burkholderiales bacterium]
MGFCVIARSALVLGSLVAHSASWAASADLEVFPLAAHERLARQPRSEKLRQVRSAVVVPVVAPAAVIEAEKPSPEATTTTSAAASDTSVNDPTAQIQEWELRQEDERIDVSLKRWATKMGYNFRWDAERYVLVEASNKFRGDFPSVIRQLLGSSSIKNSSFPLEACLYNNNPPLFRVTRMGDQSEDCK